MMNSRVVLAVVVGLAVEATAQDFDFPTCLLQCDLTGSENPEGACEFWTGLQSDACTQFCTEIENTLIEDIAALSCTELPELPEGPTDGLPTLPSFLPALLAQVTELLPVCAAVCGEAISDTDDIGSACDTLTTCESSCEDEVDLRTLTELTDLVCSLVETIDPNDPGFPTSPEDFLALLPELLPECALSCTEDLGTPECGDPETCEPEWCGEEVCQYCDTSGCCYSGTTSPAPPP